MASSGIYNEADAVGGDHDSLLMPSDDSEIETETLADDSSVRGRREDEEAEFVESPTDGYFSPRDHPQQTFVQSSAQAQADSKAWEAAQTRSSNSESSRASPSNLASPVSEERPVWSNDALAILDVGPAPPEYAAATAHRRIPSIESQANASSAGDQTANFGQRQSYGSFMPSMPVPHAGGGESNEDNALHWPFGNRSPFGAEGEQRLWPFGDRANPFGNGSLSVGSNGSVFGRPVAQRRPQSISGTQAPQQASLNEETGLLRSRPKRRRYCRSRTCLNWIIVLIVAVVIIVATGTLTDWKQSDIPTGDDTGDERDKIPTPPPTSPAPPSTPSRPPTAACPYSAYSSSIAVDFASPSSFSFAEFLKPQSHLSGRIEGDLHIMSAAADEQDVAIRVWLSAATTEPWIIADLNYVKTNTSLEVKEPYLRKRSEASVRRRCFWIGVTVNVREGTVLEDFDVETANMQVAISDGLFSADGKGVRITSSSISTTHGSVEAESWASRHTRIDTVSGSIKGAYALLDSLSIHSIAGSINVNVDPKEADPENSAPAEYTAVTDSGSIKTETRAPVSLPIRDYHTRVQTQSGSITGTYVHGSATSFDSASGAIRVDVVPIAAQMLNATVPYKKRRTPETTLRTNAYSGQTVLRLLPPYIHSDNDRNNKDDNDDDNDDDYDEYEDPVLIPRLPLPIDTLHSTHKSISGSISITYPDEWTGTIEGETVSGGIHFRGKDVKTSWDGGQGGFRTEEAEVEAHAYRKVVAYKGFGKSRLNLESVSGGLSGAIGVV